MKKTDNKAEQIENRCVAALLEIESKETRQYEDIAQLESLLHKYVLLPDHDEDTRLQLFNALERVRNKFLDQK